MLLSRGFAFALIPTEKTFSLWLGARASDDKCFAIVLIEF